MAEEGKTSQETVDVAPEFHFDLPEEVVELSDTEVIQDKPEDTKLEIKEEESPQVKPEDKDDTSSDADDSKTTDTPPAKEVEEEPAAKEIEVPEGADPTAYGVYRELVDRGYIAEQEEFKGTFDELDGVFSTLPEMIFKSVFAQFDDPMKKLLKYAYAKGDAGIKWEDLNEFVSKINPIDYESADLSTESAQKAFLAAELKKEGRDDDDIQDMIDLWEDKDKLETKAKQYKSAGKAKRDAAAQALVEEEEQAKTTRKQEQIQFFNEVKTDVGDSGWTPKRKEVVLNEIFSGNMNKKSQVIKQHPRAFVQLADFLTYFDEKSGEFNLEAYSKQGASATTKNVKKTIEKNFEKVTTKPAHVKESKDFDASNFEFI